LRAKYRCFIVALYLRQGFGRQVTRSYLPGSPPSRG